ncbi:hypothetical protein GCM10027418_08150 [Mariniluteicoccus endophyticus]
MADTTRLELVDGTRAKFWEITVEGATVTTRWGRIGTDGQTKVAHEATADAARTSAIKQIAAKTKKGYAQVDGAAAAPVAPAKAARKSAGRRGPDSDLKRIKAWWKTLPTDTFVPLSAPTRSRYTQGELHEDSAEEVPEDLAYAGWHWQSHERAFDRDGTMIDKLYLHWGGEYENVLAALGDGPEGFQVTGEGEGHAFVLDKVGARRADGTPDPADQTSVRRVLDRLDEPLDRTTPLFEYADPTPEEVTWLKEALALRGLADQAPIVDHLARRSLFTAAELTPLVNRWTQAYADDLRGWPAWPETMINLLHVDAPRALELAERIGPEADHVLARRPSEVVLDLLTRHVLSDDDLDLRPWLDAYAALHGVDPFAATLALVDRLGGAHRLTKQRCRCIVHGLGAILADEAWAQRDETAWFPHLRITTHSALPRDVRDAAADWARQEVHNARVTATRDDELGEMAKECLAAYDSQPHPVVGPDLTGYAGHLSSEMGRYRTLDAPHAAWLVEQLEDPSIPVEGVSFCLEVLYAHGAGTARAVDALAKRWKKELAKNHRTTYYDWRHPMVTLTAMARELDHPLTDKLDAWWAQDRPAWIAGLRPLLHVAAPSPEGADELLRLHLAEPEQDTLRTWMLVRAAADGCRPADVAPIAGQAGVPLHRITDALVSVWDPQQPLWHYLFDETALGWLDRGLEVAEDASVTQEIRLEALGLVARHRLVAHPESGPRVTDEQRRAYVDRIDKVRSALAH